MPKFAVKVGERIAYSVQFLRSIDMEHSDMSFARGIVTKLIPFNEDFTMAVIEWEGGDDYPVKVSVDKLARVGANLRFANSN